MKRYGLLGRSLAHSFSQKYFQERWKREERSDCVYQNFELESLEELPALLEGYPDLCGLNVTIPYKQAIIPYLDELSPDAQAIGAVNTIVLGTELQGYNTDAGGFRDALQPYLKPRHRQALVLGTGGAARAISYALEQLQISPQAVSRSPAPGQMSYTQAATVLPQYQVIVNCTPQGTYPHTEERPPLNLDLLRGNHLVVDLIYNPPLSSFLQQAREKGATILNGKPMLIAQAERAWGLWQES